MKLFGRINQLHLLVKINQLFGGINPLSMLGKNNQLSCSTE